MQMQRRTPTEMCAHVLAYIHVYRQTDARSRHTSNTHARSHARTRVEATTARLQTHGSCQSAYLPHRPRPHRLQK
eukprot:2188277-Pleurochrysis_carterae.AAC.1